MDPTLAGEILDALIRANLAASAAILLVFALRKTARRTAGARVAYGLWLLPLLAGAAVLAPARQIVVAAPISPPPLIAAAVDAAPITADAGGISALEAVPVQAGLQFDARLLIMVTWLAGVAGSALVMTYLQRRFIAEACKGVIGPAVVGVIAPRIVTPEDFDAKFSGEEQTLVLAHEHAHIDRQDSRLNGLSAALQCLFWFNPLVHLAAHLMRIDQEMACDETVVTRFPDARRAYAQALVKAQLAIRPLPLGCYWPSRNEHPLYERIAMLSRHDFSRARRLAGASALALICAATGVAAWASQPAEVRIAREDAVVPPALVPSPAVAHTPLSTGQPSAPPMAQGADASKSIALAQNQAPAPAVGTAASDVPPTLDEISRLRAEQEQPQQLIPFDPAHFDKYVGYYQLGPNVVFKITRDGSKLLTQLTGQGPVQVYPESETKFFATVVAAQVSFVSNAQGEVTELILHQNGQEQHAKKIDEAAAKNIEAVLADRIKNNMPSPGTEAFLRRYIASQEAGKPDYSEMTPGLELAARTQQDRLTSDIAKWGPLLSVEFTRVNPGGNDVYMLTFKNEKVPTIVAPVRADGKVGGLLFQPQ